jgi:hypothetical protein
MPLTLKVAAGWAHADRKFLAAFVALSDGEVVKRLPDAVGPCLVMFRGEQPVARAACIGGPGYTTLGWFAARERDAAVSLLRTICEEAQRLSGAQACVVGPLNGNTWGHYRLALPGGSDEPPFPGEPTNPPEYSEYFLSAGFRVAAAYESRIVEDLSPRPGAEALARRAEREGICIRPLDRANGERELDALFALSSAAFAENPYYQPISREAFDGMYGPVLASVDPELVRLAHDRDGRLIAFALAYPEGGGSNARVVLKSAASAPNARVLGLSAVLADQIHARAAQQSYRGVVHALMRSDNPSAAISRRYGGRGFRRYALYEWTP